MDIDVLAARLLGNQKPERDARAGSRLPYVSVSGRGPALSDIDVGRSCEPRNLSNVGISTEFRPFALDPRDRITRLDGPRREPPVARRVARDSLAAYQYSANRIECQLTNML